MTWADIDAVVLGKAPDLFEGVMKPELYMSDALGATGKPMFRVHTAGSVGGTTGIVGVAPRAVGRAQAGAGRRLREAVGRQRAVRARERAGRAASARAARSRRSCGPTSPAAVRPSTSGWQVAVKDRQNAVKNEYAHLKIRDISIEKVRRPR